MTNQYCHAGRPAGSSPESVLHRPSRCSARPLVIPGRPAGSNPESVSIHTRQPSPIDLWPQIAPVRIRFLDQGDFPRSLPLLQLLLALDGFDHRAKLFEMHQAMYPVPLGKTIRCIVAMLPDALDQIRRDANVKCAVWFGGQHVNGRSAHGAAPKLLWR